MDNNLHFGFIINQLREERNLTKEKFADMIGYSAANVTKILRKEDVGTDVLKKVCDAFELDLSYFLDKRNYIYQKGKANIGGNGNIQYKGEGNIIGPDENKLQMLLNENEHLKEQLQGLKDQNTLLREMVEILKAKT